MLEQTKTDPAESFGRLECKWESTPPPIEHEIVLALTKPAGTMIAVPRNLPISLFAAVVALTYGLHVFGPLRLVDDAPLYLSGAVDLADGRGYQDDHMPRGYSHALATLELVGLASPAGIIALNLFCALAGFVCVGTVLRNDLELSHRETLVVCLLSCMSWMWIYLIAVPMSEMLYFFLSSGALAMLSLARLRTGRRAAVCLAGAVIVSIGAFFVRTIGAALFVPVAISILERTVVNWGVVGPTEGVVDGACRRGVVGRRRSLVSRSVHQPVVCTGIHAHARFARGGCLVACGRDRRDRAQRPL